MFKTILLIKKRSDLSRQEFREYYDKQHLPFMLDLLPGKLALHRRNYIVDGSDFEYREQAAGTGWPGHFDVITEAIYESRADAEALTALCRDPAIYSRIIADEANFIAPGGVKKYIVDTCETKIR